MVVNVELSFGAILTLALGLAMDATAVAAGRGLAAPVVRWRHVAVVGALFGGAQAVMPLVGWTIGQRVGPWIQAWDHWLAFVLLTGIGAKMLWEARRMQPQHAPSARGDAFGMRVLLMLAFATSIDALAVGVTLPMLGAPIVLSVVTIGVTTAVLSAAAVAVGRKLGARLGPRLDAMGGAVLLGLGVTILVQHLRAVPVP